MRASVVHSTKKADVTKPWWCGLIGLFTDEPSRVIGIALHLIFQNLASVRLIA